MRILLLGKDGQVGQALQPELGRLGEVAALGRADADLEQPGELPRIIATLSPDVIVNAAAYTAVDKAETDADRARLVNAEAVATLAAAAQRSGAWLVHYSTDYVFDGLKPAEYVETDEPHPLSVYGATKLRGDIAITSSSCKHLIFRVSWVYAAGHANFPRTMLRLARDRQSLNVVSDQFGAPTSARLVASITTAAIARAVESGTDAGGLGGLYNLAPSGAVSRSDFVRFLVGEARALGAPLALAPEGVVDLESADFPTPAARPLNSRLSTQKLEAAFGVVLPPWQDDARRWVAETVKEGAY